MKFFIPHADSPEQTQNVVDATVAFTGFSLPNPPISSVEYVHDGHHIHAEVGKDPHAHYRTSGPIILILEKPGCLAICTPHRGVLRGEPIYVGDHAIQNVLRFDSDE